MDPQRENLVKLVFGSLSVCLFLIVACLSINVFFPADSDSNVVPLVSRNARDAESIPVETYSEDDKDLPAAVADGETVSASETVSGDDVGFVADLAAETDVGIEFDFPLSKSDAGLVFYRQQQSKSSVEWFYTNVAGSRDIAVAILDAASEFNISPALAFSLAYAESMFKTDAKHTNVNGTVDRGLFQLNSGSFPKLSMDDFYDPRISAYYGMSHLKYCIETAGNEIAGLAMYNAGRNKVQNNNTPQTTLNYISTIEEYKANLQEKFASEVIAFYSGNKENYLVKY
ncbi:MAG: transglycosylase SLT domain-containing protein [Treponema sp.]|nr:transglycosylase SLT domain-containing protein [Treponema sp.]